MSGCNVCECFEVLLVSLAIAWRNHVDVTKNMRGVASYDLNKGMLLLKYFGGSFMKKVLLVFMSICLLLSLFGCGALDTGDTSDVDSSGVVSGSHAVGEPNTGEPDESSVISQEPVEVERVPVTFTEENLEAMTAKLQECVYSSFMQEMENGLGGQAVYSTTRYSLSVNLEQNIHSITMRYITVDGINRDGLGYKMYSDGEKYIVSEDGKWVEAGEEYETLAWDLSEFTNIWDLVSYLMHDFQFPVGKEGLSTGDYWTFEYSEPADDSLLSGIEYDTLLDADYKFTFRVKDDIPTPDSVVVTVGYTVGEETYYVKSTLQFNTFGDTAIAMPKVGTDS